MMMRAETGTATWGAEHAPVGDQQALIAACLAGDGAAYEQLYETYAGQIYRLVYGMLQHREDAEEVLQDSFEYAFRRLHRFDPCKAAFKTWLYQIAISRCRNKRRRKWLPTFSLNQANQKDIADPAAPSPADRALLSSKQRLVWEALATLSPKLRSTAILRYFEGLTYQEIGTVLDIPAKTAESRMRLAHQALREYLSDKDVI